MEEFLKKKKQVIDAYGSCDTWGPATDHSQLGLCQSSPGGNVYLLPQRAEGDSLKASLRIYKEGVERLERSKDEYRGLELHVVIAHYKEKVRKMWSRKWQG